MCRKFRPCNAYKVGKHVADFVFILLISYLELQGMIMLIVCLASSLTLTKLILVVRT